MPATISNYAEQLAALASFDTPQWPQGYVNVPDAATYTLLAKNSGKVHIFPDLTADTVITMPAEAAGLVFEFMYSGAAADAHDWLFDTGSNTNYFSGGVVHLDADSGTGADEIVPVFSDNNSNSKFTVLVPAAGTWIKMWCNGTIWYVTGTVVAATAPSFADQ